MKKMNKIAAVLMALVLLLAMTACGGGSSDSKTVNIADYFEPVIYGANGIASVRWELDKAAFGDALTEGMSNGSLTEKLNSDTSVSDMTPEEIGQKIWETLDYSVGMACYVNGEESTETDEIRVSNGDKVTLKFTLGDLSKVEDNFNVSLTCDEEKSFTVKDLEEPVEIDIFDFLDYSCERIDSQWEQYRIKMSCDDNTDLVEGKSRLKEFDNVIFTLVDVLGDEEEEYSLYYDAGYDSGKVWAGDSLTIEVSLSYMGSDGYTPHYFKLVNTSQDFTVKNGKVVRC